MSATTPSGKSIPHEILLRIFTALRSHDDFPSLLAVQRTSKSIYSLLTPILYKHLELTPGSAFKLFDVMKTFTPVQVGQLYHPFDFAIEPYIQQREPPMQLPLGISVDLFSPHRLRAALCYTRSIVVHGPTPDTPPKIDLLPAKAIAFSLRSLTKQLLFPNVRRVSVRAGSTGVGWSPFDEKRHYELIQLLAEGSRIDHFCLHDNYSLKEGLSILRIFAGPIDYGQEQQVKEKTRRLETVTIHGTKDIGLPLTLVNPHKEMKWSLENMHNRAIVDSEEEEDFIGWILPMQMERLVGEIWKIESQSITTGGESGPEKGWTVVLPLKDLELYKNIFLKTDHGKVSENRAFVEGLEYKYIEEKEKIKRDKLRLGQVVRVDDDEEDFNYTDWIKQVRAGRLEGNDAEWPWMSKMVREEEEKRRKVRELSKGPKINWIAREKIGIGKETVQLNPCEACGEPV